MILKVHFNDREMAELEAVCARGRLRPEAFVRTMAIAILEVQKFLPGLMAAAQGRPNLHAVAGGAKPKRKARPKAKLRAVR
jgi:hypothetical protein